MDLIEIKIVVVDSINTEDLENHVWELEQERGLISFTEEEYKNMDKSPFIKKCWDVSLFVNGELVQLYSDLTRILTIYNFNDELSERELSIFTSPHCDIPEDDGIWEYVKVNQKENTIVWDLIDEKTSKKLKAKQLVFSKSQYREQVENVWRMLYSNLHPEIYDSSLFLYTMHDMMTSIKLLEPISYRSVWDLKK